MLSTDSCFFPLTFNTFFNFVFETFNRISYSLTIILTYSIPSMTMKFITFFSFTILLDFNSYIVL